MLMPRRMWTFAQVSEYVAAKRTFARIGDGYARGEQTYLNGTTNSRSLHVVKVIVTLGR